MQLAEFILKNIEPIAQEWEFARTCIPGAIGMSKGALLDDITQILDAVVDEMEHPHIPAEQATKGKSQRLGGIAFPDGPWRFEQPVYLSAGKP